MGHLSASKCKGPVRVNQTIHSSAVESLFGCLAYENDATYPKKYGMSGALRRGGTAHHCKLESERTQKKPHEALRRLQAAIMHRSKHATKSHRQRTSPS